MSTPSLLRSSGILLHPTSLPGPFGIGDLGPIAFRWVETLAAMKQSWWQVLPLGPTGAGDSPYQSFSAFAGNVNLLSPEVLQQDGLVSADLWAGEQFPGDQVDYARVTPFKTKLLRAAWDGFRGGKAAHLKHDFENYCAVEAGWLDRLRPVRRHPRGARRQPASTAWPAGPAAAEPGRAGGAGEEARQRDPAAQVRAVPVRPPVGRAEGVRQRPRHQGDRRRPHLRGPRLGRRVGQPGPVPARRRPPADGGGRRAAGLLRGRRPALGQPALRLGADGGDRVTRGGSPACCGS